jgi:beta-N-acetylhexosaminidase
MVAGPVMNKDYHSFVGDYELPMRYGLTVGEMAQYYLAYTGIRAHLTIVPMSGYERSMTYLQTGLLWNVPSPSLPTFESTLCYMGGCLFEATNISEGRGCSKPFQMYGAPFIDMDKLYRDLTGEYKEDEILFRRRSFIPGFSKHQGKVCYGLEFFPVKENCDFLTVSLVMMKAIARRYPEQVEFFSLEEDAPYSRLSVLSGNGLAEQYIREEISLRDMQEAWQEDSRPFCQLKNDICIYK